MTSKSRLTDRARGTCHVRGESRLINPKGTHKLQHCTRPPMVKGHPKASTDRLSKRPLLVYMSINSHSGPPLAKKKRANACREDGRTMRADDKYDLLSRTPSRRRGSTHSTCLWVLATTDGPRAGAATVVEHLFFGHFFFISRFSAESALNTTAKPPNRRHAHAAANEQAERVRYRRNHEAANTNEGRQAPPGSTPVFLQDRKIQPSFKLKRDKSRTIAAPKNPMSQRLRGIRDGQVTHQAHKRGQNRRQKRTSPANPMLAHNPLSTPRRFIGFAFLSLPPIGQILSFRHAPSALSTPPQRNRTRLTTLGGGHDERTGGGLKPWRRWSWGPGAFRPRRSQRSRTVGCTACASSPWCRNGTEHNTTRQEGTGQTAQKNTPKRSTERKRGRKTRGGAGAGGHVIVEGGRVTCAWPAREMRKKANQARASRTGVTSRLSSLAKPCVRGRRSGGKERKTWNQHQQPARLSTSNRTAPRGQTACGAFPCTCRTTCYRVKLDSSDARQNARNKQKGVWCYRRAEEPTLLPCVWLYVSVKTTSIVACTHRKRKNPEIKLSISLLRGMRTEWGGGSPVYSYKQQFSTPTLRFLGALCQSTGHSSRCSDTWGSSSPKMKVERSGLRRFQLFLRHAKNNPLDRASWSTDSLVLYSLVYHRLDFHVFRARKDAC